MSSPKPPPIRLRAEKRKAHAQSASLKAKAKSPARAAQSRQNKATKARRAWWRPRRLRLWPQSLILRLLLWPLWLVWWLSTRLALIGLLILGAATAYYYAGLPDARVLMDDRIRNSITMLDRHSEVFAWRGDQFGGLVTAETVSPHLRNAVIATEDKRFYRHLGVSPRGILGAIRTNMREGRSPLDGHGGSTITQQVAKRVFFDDISGMARKIREVPMSLAMELRYSKDEILTIYLNRAYLGAGSYGFEAASQRYFSKSAREVTPAEAAMLAGLLKAPSTFAPTRNLGRAQDRANLIISLMQDQGYLSASEAAEAQNNPATLSEQAKAQSGGFFADWIMEAAPDFLIRDAREDIIIQTTFDPSLQAKAEAALEEVLSAKLREGSNVQAAVIVMSADGAVRAMVGGRQSGIAGQFNRATQALRQTGSLFKPFVFAAALEAEYSPLSIVEDAPLTINVPGSGPWSPKNYSRNYRGPITFTDALVHSVNTATVRVSELVGRQRVRAIATDFGVRQEIDTGPALALGTSESTLLDMTGAYAGFLNGGVKARPYGLVELRLQGEDAPLMGKTGGSGHRVINEKAAEELIYMMHQVVERGTGARAKIANWEVAGKTGTTQAARDAWFIGFTSDYVAGVWMGYDDNSPMSGVTGGGLPAEIWARVMEKAHAGLTPQPLPMRAPYVAQTPTPQQPAGSADDIEAAILRDLMN